MYIYPEISILVQRLAAYEGKLKAPKQFASEPGGNQS
jgi:hypothetical protein